MNTYTLVAFGDSTTAKSDDLMVYSDLLSQKRLPDGRALRVINAGIPSNTTADGRERYQKDVLAENPNGVIIQFGINDSAFDVWKNPPATSPRVTLSDYRDNLEYFMSIAQERAMRVILMTPNPMVWTPVLKDLYGKPPYVTSDVNDINLSLRRYVDIMRMVARERAIELVDIFAHYQTLAEKEARPFTDFLKDGIHPNASGHAEVALLLERHLFVD